MEAANAVLFLCSSSSSREGLGCRPAAKVRGGKTASASSGPLSRKKREPAGHRRARRDLDAALRSEASLQQAKSLASQANFGRPNPIFLNKTDESLRTTGDTRPSDSVSRTAGTGSSRRHHQPGCSRALVRIAALHCLRDVTFAGLQQLLVSCFHAANILNSQCMIFQSFDCEYRQFTQKTARYGALRGKGSSGV
jgi:hypothetical protein